jgi:hypothetical protein
MTPLLQAIFPIAGNACCGLVMGIMIIPCVSSVTEDAASVPMNLREGSYDGSDAFSNSDSCRHAGSIFWHCSCLYWEYRVRLEKQWLLQLLPNLT